MFLQNSLKVVFEIGLRGSLAGFFHKFLTHYPLKVLFLCFHGSRKTWEKVYRDRAAKICVMCQSQREDLKILIILMGKDYIWGLRSILRGCLKVPRAWHLLRWVGIYISKNFSSIYFWCLFESCLTSEVEVAIYPSVFFILVFKERTQTFLWTLSSVRQKCIFRKV